MRKNAYLLAYKAKKEEMLTLKLELCSLRLKEAQVKEVYGKDKEIDRLKSELSGKDSRIHTLVNELGEKETDLSSL